MSCSSSTTPRSVRVPLSRTRTKISPSPSFEAHLWPSARPCTLLPRIHPPAKLVRLDTVSANSDAPACYRIHNIGFIQSYFWRNAGFDVIHDIPELHEYSARYDPTVIPIGQDATATIATSAEALPAPTQRRSGSTGYYTSADYHALYKSGELTPLAVAEAVLPLIRRDSNPRGKHSVAFLESNVDKVRAAAEASTQRYKDGKPLGPLDGILVAVKDELNMEGYKRTLGSKLDFTGGIQGTSWCVKKWQEAGAIVIGKTTMHELGLGESFLPVSRSLDPLPTHPLSYDCKWKNARNENAPRQ